MRQVLIIVVCGLWVQTGSSSWISARLVAQGVTAVNGMTISTPRGGRDWGSDAMVGTIAKVKSLGSNWIAIHPYASIDRTGRVSWRRRDGDPEAAPAWLTRPIAEAHRQGVQILIKPHLAHWRTGFSWRGEIAFRTAEEWERFFRTYAAWITQVARFSRDADAFAVGTELELTVAHDARWREIIAGVRQVFPGTLTYAANWTGYDAVPFWDALDLVGIQAYFPILQTPDDTATAGVPAAAAFEQGWRGIMGRIRGFSERTGRPVVFTELGYNSSARAPYEPWDATVGGANAEILQERSLQAALQAIAAEPSVRGAFLWKWFPGERTPRNFAMSRPAIQRIISEHWADGGLRE